MSYIGISGRLLISKHAEQVAPSDYMPKKRTRSIEDEQHFATKRECWHETIHAKKTRSPEVTHGNFITGKFDDVDVAKQWTNKEPRRQLELFGDFDMTKRVYHLLCSI